MIATPWAKLENTWPTVCGADAEDRAHQKLMLSRVFIVVGGGGEIIKASVGFSFSPSQSV
jgi:hypothetical protein